MLDLDDLYIIYAIGQGHNMHRISSDISITVPAISHRIKKQKKALGDIYETCGKGKRHVLTMFGRYVAEKAENAIKSMLD